MAKTRVLCPFSNELCRECPSYRGRHYYLCFHSGYRGCLSGREDDGYRTSWTNGYRPRHAMPGPLPNSEKWLILSDFVEREAP